MSLRSKKKGELSKEDLIMDTEDANASSGNEAMLGETLSLDSIRSVIKHSMTEAMSALENNISKQLSDFQHNFKEDIMKQLGEMRSEINQRMEVTAGKIAATSQRLDEAEERIREVETFSGEVKDVLTRVQKTQLALQSKITELEGHSHRNNIRIYGIREGAEGTSMTNFVDNLIKTNLGANNVINMDDLGIERAHRALGAKPPETAAPSSTVVRFARYTTKEKVLSAAWKKPITVDGKRIYFDHDYATGVMEKRREYLPIKKILKLLKILKHSADENASFSGYRNSHIWKRRPSGGGFTSKGLPNPAEGRWRAGRPAAAAPRLGDGEECLARRELPTKHSGQAR